MSIRAAFTSGVAWLRHVSIGGGTETAKLGGVIHIDATHAATIADTNLTTLVTYSLPANTLNTDGQSLRLTAWGQNAANGNTKNYFLTFGGDTVASRGTSNSGTGWRLEAVLTRVGANSYDYSGLSIDGTSMTAGVPANASETMTAAIVIAVKALNGSASADDCQFDGILIEFLP